MYFHDNYYSLTEVVKTFYSFVITRLFYRPASLIRRPFYIRGNPRMQIGEGFTTGYNCRFEIFGERADHSKKLIFGKGCHIGDNVHIAAFERVEIGDNCLMASKIFISDCSHGSYGGGTEASDPCSDPNKRTLSASPVSVGNNVWIGENVCILSGVSIGDGVVIGANSVVTKSLPSNVIAVGIPARILKSYNEETHQWKTVGAD